MALNSKVISIDAGTSATTVNSGSLGFTPKAVIAWCGNRAADGQGPDGNICLGFSDGTNTRSAHHSVRDNTASYTEKYFLSTNLLVNGTVGTGGIDRVINVNALNADDVDFGVDAGNDLQFNALVLGGSDITNVHVGTFTPAAAFGDFSVTGVGFVPDALIIVGIDSTAATEDSYLSRDGFFLGMATDPTEQHSMYVASSSTAPKHHMRDDLIGSIPNTSATTERFTLSLTSFDADGFTLSRGGANETNQCTISYIAIKGGNWKVDSSVTRTDTSTTAVTGVGFQPTGLFAFSSMLDTAYGNGTTGDEYSISLGAATGAAERGSMWTGTVGGANPSEADNALNQAAMLIGHVNTTGLAQRAAVDLVSFGADGFTFAQDDADDAAHVFSFLAMGSTSGGGGGGGPVTAVLTGTDGFSGGLANYG